MPSLFSQSRGGGKRTMIGTSSTSSTGIHHHRNTRMIHVTALLLGITTFILSELPQRNRSDSMIRTIQLLRKEYSSSTHHRRPQE